MNKTSRFSSRVLKQTPRPPWEDGTSRWRPASHSVSSSGRLQPPLPDTMIIINKESIINSNDAEGDRRMRCDVWESPRELNDFVVLKLYISSHSQHNIVMLLSGRGSEATTVSEVRVWWLRLPADYLLHNKTAGQERAGMSPVLFLSTSNVIFLFLINSFSQKSQLLFLL